jgi:hypothetical protein
MTTKKSAATKSDAAKSEVRITISDQSRDITLETVSDREEVLELVKSAISSSSPLVMTDTRGRQILIPANKIGSVEVGDISERKVGFTTL